MENSGLLYCNIAWRIGACGLVSISMGCASLPSEDNNQLSAWQNGTGISKPSISYWSNDELEAQARSLFSDLSGQDIKTLSVSQNTVARISIGGAASSEVIAHETTLAGPFSQSKAENLTGERGPGNILQPIQNGPIDNGWRQDGNNYFHLPSGFQCDATQEITINDDTTGETTSLVVPINQVRIFDDAGTDSACDYVNETEGVYLTFFVSKWPDVALDDHFGSALQHIVDRFPVAEEAPLFSMDMTIDTKDYESSIKGDTLSGAFHLVPQDGTTVKTALWLNQTGDWHIKARATYIAATNGETPQTPVPAELLATVLHAVTLHTVDRHINSSNNEIVEVSY